jgi:hypothetical protein
VEGFQVQGVDWQRERGTKKSLCGRSTGLRRMVRRLRGRQVLGHLARSTGVVWRGRGQMAISKM